MSGTARIFLYPLGARIDAPPGTPLDQLLFGHGVEFPCGGRGRCGRCRVRVLEGALPASPEDETTLGREAVAAGWRLACHARVAGDVTIEIAQWESAILADDSAFPFTPQEGLGMAVDLGTTTVVAQLVDLSTGRVLAVRSGLNPQVRFGADIMTRVECAVNGGEAALTAAVREGVGALVADLAPAAPVRRAVVVGNTVMHHLFCGLDVRPLAHCPFETEHGGAAEFPARELGWSLPGDPPVRFLRSLGGFVGSDILAGLLATRMPESADPVLLLDLGTNGEIALGNRDRILCASTAAGPAFEGGRIGMGMRAATGAIAEVAACDGRLECRVLGNGPARGICGSGLVDAVAAALDLALIRPNGRLAQGKTLPLEPPVVLTQQDIRELQLAKAATAAGIRLLLDRWGAAPAQIRRVYLAGAFSNYLNRASARRIGLFDFPDDVVHPSGNTALLGAKIALFGDDAPGLRVEHVPLGMEPEFQNAYVAAMTFPVR